MNIYIVVYTFIYVLPVTLPTSAPISVGSGAPTQLFLNPEALPESGGSQLKKPSFPEDALPSTNDTSADRLPAYDDGTNRRTGALQRARFDRKSQGSYWIFPPISPE